MSSENYSTIKYICDWTQEAIEHLSLLSALSVNILDF